MQELDKYPCYYVWKSVVHFACQAGHFSHVCIILDTEMIPIVATSIALHFNIMHIILN